MINNDRRAIPTVKISAVHPIREEQFQTIEIRFVDGETSKRRQEDRFSSKERSNSDHQCAHALLLLSLRTDEI